MLLTLDSSKKGATYDKTIYIVVFTIFAMFMFF